MSLTRRVSCTLFALNLQNGQLTTERKSLITYLETLGQIDEHPDDANPVDRCSRSLSARIVISVMYSRRQTETVVFI